MEHASDLRAISQWLQAEGVRVVNPWGPYLGAADLVIFCDGQPDAEEAISIYNTRCMISFREGQWRLTVEDGMAGPGPQGLEHFLASLEEVISFALAYCQGAPSEIAGWLVPLHRHPEWDEARVRHAITHARQISAAEWDRTLHEARAEYNRLVHASHPRLTEHPRPIAWDEWYACLFVCIAPADPACAETLWLRRDLQAAYRI